MVLCFDPTDSRFLDSGDALLATVIQNEVGCGQQATKWNEQINGFSVLWGHGGYYGFRNHRIIFLCVDALAKLSRNRRLLHYRCCLDILCRNPFWFVQADNQRGQKVRRNEYWPEVHESKCFYLLTVTNWLSWPCNPPRLKVVPCDFILQRVLNLHIYHSNPVRCLVQYYG